MPSTRLSPGIAASRCDWFPDWQGAIVVVIASGPSAKQAFEPFRNRAKWLVVNNSFALAPWADALLASDSGWWLARDGVPEFKGLKMAVDGSIRTQYPEIKHVRLDLTDGLSLNPGFVGRGQNSGFYACNMAMQFGPPRRLVLAGFDYHGKHWHGDHPAGFNNPDGGMLKAWAEKLDRQAPTFKALGVEVVNTSASSRLTAYPKMTLAEAFAC